MLFSDIFGHNELKKKLINTVKNQRISHAQLFLGPEGSGKLSLAIAYAQYVNCENPSDGDSCGECKSCKKYNKLVHPDLHFVYPVVKNKKLTKPVSIDYIDKWREFIIDSKYHSFQNWLKLLNSEKSQAMIYAEESKEIIRIINLKTFEAKYKVLIIYLPEYMNISAANKLLKAIEEPPPNTLYILVSENESKIINTILSRTQLVKFPRYSDDEVVEYLNLKNEDKSSEQISDIAKISEGNIVYAEQIFNDNHIQGDSVNDNFSLFVDFMKYSYSFDFPMIVNFIYNISKLNREQQKIFLQYSLRMIRENFIMNTSPEEDLIHITKKERDFSRKFNKIIHQSNIFALYEQFNSAYYNISRNASAKILFMDLMLKTGRLLKTKKNKNG